MVPNLLDARGATHARAHAHSIAVTLAVGGLRRRTSRPHRRSVPIRRETRPLRDDIPLLVSDSAAAAVPVFPREDEDSAICNRAPRALHRPSKKAVLVERGFGSTMRIPVLLENEKIGRVSKWHTSKPRPPSFEDPHSRRVVCSALRHAAGNRSAERRLTLWLVYI
jgi:hypothetical protein